MFRRIEDVVEMWRQEEEKTLAVMDAIPDAAAHQAVDAHHRDLRRMAWHLVESTVELPEHMGIRVAGFPGEPFKVPPPPRMATIRDTYAAVGASFRERVAPLNAMALAAVYPCYGESWTGAFLMMVLVQHQTHHRGQMTVLMRQAGLKVPELYGPTLESWSAYGMPAPQV